MIKKQVSEHRRFFATLPPIFLTFFRVFLEKILKIPPSDNAINATTAINITNISVTNT